MSYKLLIYIVQCKQNNVSGSSRRVSGVTPFEISGNFLEVLVEDAVGLKLFEDSVPPLIELQVFTYGGLGVLLQARNS